MDLVAFAKALDDAGVKFFGAAWCPHCTEQKELFEDGGQFLPFFEVTNPDRTLNQLGIDEEITSFPTWELPNKTRYEEVFTPEELSALTGVAIPMSSNPFIAPIGDQTVLGGSPLHIPLDGYDPNGGPLTYTVEVNNATVDLQATILEGNRSLSFEMGTYGTVTFQAFDQRVSGVTDPMLGLATDGTWEDTIFHRIINGFVIQGGDPTGSGQGDPSIPDFDDMFHEDLQHNRTGLLSMAKQGRTAAGSGDDTNSSQFFITEGPSRSLDGNHSVWGILTEGEAVREAVSNVPTPNNTTGSGGDKPIDDVTMHNVQVFFDEENGVMMLKAPEGASGSAEVSVTVTDEDGNQFVETFDVTIEPDTSNTGPWLINTPDQVTTLVNTPAVFSLEALDIEGDEVSFSGANLSNVNLNGSSIDPETGEASIVTPTDFVGTFQIEVNVIAPGGSDTPDHIDTQTVTINVVDPSVTPTVDLLSSSDSGASNSDNITRLTNVQFQVTGLGPEVEVTLFSGSTVIGTATAQGSSVVITSDLSSFGDMIHEITAQQEFGGVQSPLSSPLFVEIDTTIGPFSTDPVTDLAPGEDYAYDVEHIDEGLEGFFYSLPVAPDGMTIDETSGLIQWSPTGADAGTHSVIVRAEDIAGNVRTQSFSLEVPNAPPEITEPVDDQNINEGDTLIVDVDATDANLPNDTLTFSLDTDVPADDSSAGASAGLNSASASEDTQPSIDPESGVIEWTPSELHGGETYHFTVTVTDSGGLTDQTEFQVTVAEVNMAPVLDPIANRLIIAGETLSFSASATDEDRPAQQLTFSLPGVAEGEAADPPAGATITSDGQFFWTPSESQARSTYTIKVRVTDELGLEHDQSFMVTVQDSPVAPVFDPVSARTVPEGDEVFITLNATDGNIQPDGTGDTLTYSLQSGPAGATLDGESGEFRWQTGEADGPGDYDVTVRVTDATGLFDETTFTITVEEVNQPPIVEPIEDQTVTAGETLRVQIVAHDEDLPEQLLSYGLTENLCDSDSSVCAASIPLLPSGVSVDSSTGEFVWNVPSDLEGDYDFFVRVSDEHGGSKAIAFKVNVIPRQTSDAAVADQLARRAAAPRVVVVPTVLPSQNTTPVFIPALVTQIQPVGAAPSQVSAAFRTLADIGSGGGQSIDRSSDDSSDSNSVTPATNLEPAKGDHDDAPPSGKKSDDERSTRRSSDDADSDKAAETGLSDAIDQALAELAAEGQFGS